MAGRVLVVDDDQGMCELAAEGLGCARLRSRVANLRRMKRSSCSSDEDFDVVLADIHLEGTSGLELCERMLARRTDVCVVVMTAFGSLEGAIGAIRAGAYDFVIKPVSMDALALAVERATQHRQLRAEVKRLRERVESQELPNMVGDSPAMKQVSDLVSRVAAERRERADHRRERHRQGAGRAGDSRTQRPQRARSWRSTARRFPRRCSKASCSGTRAARSPTRMRRARACSSRPTAARFSSTRSARCRPACRPRSCARSRSAKCGRWASRPRLPFDARIITATNRDLEAEVADKRFREDLYYRINVVRIEVPPLRARGNDALLLAQHFLARGAARSGKPVSGLGSAVAEKLLSLRLARQRARARELHRARGRVGRLRRDHARRSARRRSAITEIVSRAAGRRRSDRASHACRPSRTATSSAC